MPDILIYLFKLMACSGILLLYYRIALYNKGFHQWNRVFLLGAVVTSLVLPLVKIYIPEPAVGSEVHFTKLLNVVVTHEGALHDDEAMAVAGFDWLTAVYVIYFSVCAFFLFLLMKGLVRLKRLRAHCPNQRIENCRLVMTEEKDAPFSFFRNIFWNIKISLDSDSSKKILRHELVHVRQMHTIDRLFTNVALVIFWCNPFYWLIRRELIVVHEFIADAETIVDGDTSVLSGMVLASAFPGYDFAPTSRFTSSSIKRRLIMLTKMKSPAVGYLGRLFILPVLFALIMAFSLCTKEGRKASVNAAKPFTVMIDAGHGGGVSGARADDGTMEKDLALSIANKVKELNNDGNIRILLTRTGDYDSPLRDRVATSVSNKVDAFISIHVNTADPSTSGFEFYVSKNDSKYTAETQVLGSLLSQELNKLYPVAEELKKRSDGKGVWVLDAPEITYPSLLVECGNIRNANDLAFIKSEANQERIARSILNAIQSFAQQERHTVALRAD
jgi:N-acetylmuramoyl-L-alanine amidase